MCEARLASWYTVLFATRHVRSFGFPVLRLMSNFGGSGHGFKLAPPIGKALASIICGESPAIDIKTFRPERFIEGEPITSAWGEGNRG